MGLRLGAHEVVSNGLFPGEGRGPERYLSSWIPALGPIKVVLLWEPFAGTRPALSRRPSKSRPDFARSRFRAESIEAAAPEPCEPLSPAGDWPSRRAGSIA